MRIDQEIVRQKDHQLHIWIVTHETDDVLCDRLFGHQMGPVKPANIVAPQTTRCGHTIQKSLERFGLRPEALWQGRTLFCGKGVAAADLSKNLPRTTERHLHEIRTERLPQ